MPDAATDFKADPLELELLGGMPLLSLDRKRLSPHGCPEAALLTAFLSLTKARFFRDPSGCRRFSPNEDDGRGPWRLAVQAGVLDEDGILVNLAAFDIVRPNIWGMRECCTIVGHFYGRASDDPVPVHRNVLEWIAADGDGILVANPRYAWRYLRDAPLLVKSGDVGFAKRLRAMRRPPKCDLPLLVESAAV